MLECSCSFDDPGDGWYYYFPHDFSIYKHKRRKRCCSCNAFIGAGDTCVSFDRYRSSRSDVEERIRGDEVSLADFFMCEKCGEIYFNLSGVGYCINLGDNMRDILSEYWGMTGFKRNKSSKNQ